MRDIDLRLEIKQLLKEYGYYILLQRTDRRVRCRCWHPVKQEALSDCPYCNGAGWVIRLEKIRCRNDPAMQIVTYPDMNKTTPQGNSWVPANTIFLEYSAVVQTGDIIYIVGWNGRRVGNLKEVHEINHPQPLRGDGGRIEFWRVSTKVITLGKKKIAMRLVGGIPIYEVSGA